ncbi:MAG: DNA polymerase III subunit beta [Meiothermus sp.]|uniref:DNA polymerase III subunit beta n=1 Tax=Meiothermus sp. TaxID=1955249 RepID=UPI0025D338AA|nr:DNA polymerase III subunit beta [Meiothermus sp.]MCS7057303.1 DNA polymerase III subunit beta [Meiothermus sp.]MCS7194880.1 DNA polymerase III subunit beta [Meiothermus sp.]MCX7739514.1 DNA polymerase III subunit beta [Meiothermus sp.]MDW8091266.1 DNA polymerase III subunit beta [Meiothermus sp.]MDW8480385.1 DNA polymerase III subunit beta [Meiothermus sp.]
MKVHIPKRTLAEGLSVLERIIPSRSSNPVLTYLPIELSEGALVLRGTNGEVDLEVKLPAETEGLGQVLVPAQTFFQIVRSAPGDLVELVFGEGEQLELHSGAFSTQLSTTSPEGYPELLFASDEGGRIGAAQLAQAITRVRYAASTEEYRAIFRGVQIEMSPQGLRTVASDGFRLARYDLPMELPSRKLVVPAKSADEIVRVFKDKEEELVFSVREGSLTLRGDSLRMSVKLMEGEFPDYERVIPQSFVLEALLKAEAFRESLRRVAVLSDRNNHRVNLLFSQERLTIDAEGDYGRGREELPLRSTGEPQLMVAYNAQYLIDALGPVEGEVRVRLSGPTSPTLLQAVEDEGYLAVVVPLRV